MFDMVWQMSSQWKPAQTKFSSCVNLDPHVRMDKVAQATGSFVLLATLPWMEEYMKGLNPCEIVSWSLLTALFQATNMLEVFRRAEYLCEPAAGAGTLFSIPKSPFLCLSPS